ncbi:hypothetical protein SBV1_100017 [Verrucomicrobia bacterium]|nr:hypothetical protein SBV1_100017 [Verrucomicrobiota bacterium]
MARGKGKGRWMLERGVMVKAWHAGIACPKTKMAELRVRGQDVPAPTAARASGSAYGPHALGRKGGRRKSGRRRGC